ncbi:sigma-54 interaction domain-containing protein [Burkholderia pseudomallei]|uniref:sigma-54 interaction domain-containing protein n=1 Tax=Burkholderia pseudomallei TaxID=28450 RepID=UPI00050FCDA2|nr:sigma 54-interacting transcriptional regulator [Burkholderia pseudomallei]KGC32542.1 sigma-54 interaction domain protein [Burkholderia pseudomallei]KGU71692.1 sigma-54 interaction domain protein [Burkholderia pseudomallei MSHR4304]KGV33204.1 sigma-54 interaction domain protein [Burkholderia pseudomallei MSHR4308]KGW65443.1 sigma-54 interaction domain protein [Burkholderia pseudomallei MSHR1029]
MNQRDAIPIVPISPPDVGVLVSYLEQDPQPMIVLDPSYRILAANAAYQRQFGIAGEAHVGRRCYQVSHHYDMPCDQAGEHCPMKQAGESRGLNRVLHIHHTPRGPEHVDVELRPIFDARGAVIAYVERLTTVRSASAKPSGEGLVGGSDAFNAALSALQRVAPSMLPVLLLGESGTGKELFARALHEASARAMGPFVVVDCSGIAETLFESELFGYEKGAFTGASARKPGLVETAQGGTLFLDEIGDVPLSMQVKLLRLIESGTFRRVGGVEVLRADFRLVAATHKPLKEMIGDGRFRQDLYYRISAYPIPLPAVRERPGDIPLLVDSILRRIAALVPAAGQRFAVAPEALARLEAYAWPGNIRELRNVLDRACLFADDGVIRVEHLPDEVACAGEAPAGPGAPAKLSDDELARIARAFDGTRRALAERVGMSERTLYRRLRALGIATRDA